MSNFICICEWAHSRSVALAKILQADGHKAVAVGRSSGGTAIVPLAEWAEKIFLLQPGFVNYVPEQHRNKCVVFDVGPDIWSNPYDQNLRAILFKLLEQYKATNL